MDALNLEQVAAERGYPARLFGYGPQQREYWQEPLARVSALLNPHRHGLDPVEARAELAGLHAAYPITDERMAPRFRRGTGVAGRLVGAAYRPCVGHVLSWQAQGRPVLARITEVQPAALVLGFDHDAETFRLAWPPAPGAQVLHVTHYTRLPVPTYDGA